MKKKYLIILFSMMLIHVNAQSNKGRCQVEVTDITKVVSLGYLASYKVVFRNNSTKTVDGIYWTVTYYNNAGELIKTEKSSFNSTELVDPISAGFTKNLVRTPAIKGASKVFIKIDKIHFSDGTQC